MKTLSPIMGISRRWYFGVSMVLLGLFGPLAKANLILDGGFEQPVVGPGGPDSGYMDFTVGQTIDGVWTVVGTGNDVSVFPGTETQIGGGTYTVEEGLQAIDLTGDFDNGDPIGVQQVVPTIAGTQYTLSFYVGHFDIADGGGSVATVILDLNGSAVLTASNSNSTSGVDNWRLFTYNFTATGSNTTLAFINGTPAGAFLGGLDNVQLNATAPEPSTLVLAGMGLLATVLVRGRTRR